MKQRKIIIAMLLAVLLVCMSAVAMATEVNPSDAGQATPAPHVCSPIAKVTAEGSCKKQQNRVTVTYACSDANCPLGNNTKQTDIQSVSWETLHKMSEWTEVKTATCTSDNLMRRVCENGCGKTETQVTVKALGHDMTTHAKTDSTCSKEGNREYFTCSREPNVYYANVNGTVRFPGESAVKLPKLAHAWKQTAHTDATCYAEGSTTYTCEKCSENRTDKIPATGKHSFSISIFNDDEVVNGKTVSKVLVERTCSNAGRYLLTCRNDGCTQQKVVNYKAFTHETAKNWETTVAATCTTSGKEVRKCVHCGKIMKSRTVKALGHNMKEEILTTATCTTPGAKKVWCTRCDAKTNNNVTIPARGHKGKWITVRKATETELGLQEKRCQNVNNGVLCNELLDTRTYKFAEMLYNNTISSFGPCTRDLIGGKDWYRVTPIDTSVDGVYTYPMIASNKYTVGTMTVTIKDGAMTVTYALNSRQITVNSESLTIYPNLDALRNPGPATALSAAFGAPIDLAANFSGDNRLIIGVQLKADYNAIGTGVSGFRVDNAAIDAMLALID